MKNIEFPSSFLVGHTVIDDDHRRLIELLNQVNHCFREKLGERTEQACTALRQFVDEHHGREEKILRETQFERLEIHIESHQRLFQNYIKVLETCGRRCVMNKKSGCMEKIYAYIIDHIVSGDLDFKSYLEESGNTDSPSPV